MITRCVFLGLVILIIIQRLWEVRLSKHNVQELLSQGGQLHHDNLLTWVKCLQVSWWICMLLEVWELDRRFIWPLAMVGVGGVILGQTLRYFSMQALGIRWTLPLITLPGALPLRKGIYAYLQHPNWLGVIIEIVALPLIHTAYITAIVFSIINAVIMYQRIRTENDALQRAVSNI